MANKLSLMRVVLAFYVVYLLYQTNPASYFSAFTLTIIVIILDGLDGYVARALKEESKVGSVIDILGDRIIENAFWITFAALGWLPAWVPILIMSRGMITDSIRGLALAQGFTAFGESSMAQSKIAQLLTSCRCTRFLYGAFKLIAFVMMIVVHTPNIEYWDPMTIPHFIAWLRYLPLMTSIAYIAVYATVALCILRAIPVILESKRFLKDEPKA